MEIQRIPSTKQTLVSITRYVSPTYTAEFDRIYKGKDVDRPDTIKFKDVKEDNILQWLKNNSLCVLRTPFPEHIQSQVGYMIITEEGAHIISPTHAEVDPISHLSRSTQNKQYERRLTIRSQPFGIPFPEGLTEALEERSFQKVDEFKRYKFR